MWGRGGCRISGYLLPHTLFSQKGKLKPKFKQKILGKE